jgi:hypothetical protein
MKGPQFFTHPSSLRSHGEKAIIERPEVVEGKK